MKKLLSVICLCMFLFSCGGGSGSGSGSLPSAVPTGTVKGTAHDNVLVGATVTAYLYTNGQKGNVLGTATTNSDGNYSLSVQAEICPALLEATGGYYKEEATSRQVNLQPGQVLDAVMNYTTGGNISVQLTPFTHIAAGLVAYRIKNGMGVATAIDTSNQDVSAMLGFNILDVAPLDVTNPLNASAYVSNGLVYGFLSAAISDWTLYGSMKVEPNTPHAHFNSIALAQLMYTDIVADGVLDGKGLDATNQLVQLSFGVLPLNANVYRHALAAHMIQFADSSPNNATSLTGAALQPFAAAYAGYSGSIFGTALPISFANSGRPQINMTPISSATCTGCGWGHGVIPVTATVSSVGSLLPGVLSVDGVQYASVSAVGPSLTFLLNSDLYSEGSHTVMVTALDSFGVSASMSQFLGVDRTSPSLSGGDFLSASYTATPVCGGSNGSFSGVSSLRAKCSIYSNGVQQPDDIIKMTPDTSGNWCFTPPLWNGVETLSYMCVLNVENRAGWSSIYGYPFAMASNPWVATMILLH